MATVKKRGSSWYVQWKELSVTKDENGEVRREWKTRARSFPTERAAKTFGAEIEVSHARGETFVEKREQAVTTIGTIAKAYTIASVEAGSPLPTSRYRSSIIGSFMDFAGEDRAVTELSLSLLESYARALPSEGRKAATRHRKVLMAEQLWRWAHDRPERFPGVPVPRRYTGGSGEGDKLRAPPPVVAEGAATWADVDAMISKLRLPWHRRVAILIRYTGLRASQACGLGWRDVNLDNGTILARSAVRGAKKGKARTIPMHPALVSEMRAWGPAEGLLFPRRYKAPDGSKRLGPYRGDVLIKPFRRAWTLAKVPAFKWDVSELQEAEGERAKGSPSHAIRRCIRTELLRTGVEEAIVLHLVGQSQGHTASAYVPDNCPEQSPYWPRMLEAIKTIPDHRRLPSA